MIGQWRATCQGHPIASRRNGGGGSGSQPAGILHGEAAVTVAPAVGYHLTVSLLVYHLPDEVVGSEGVGNQDQKPRAGDADDDEARCIQEANDDEVMKMASQRHPEVLDGLPCLSTILCPFPY